MTTTEATTTCQEITSRLNEWKGQAALLDSRIERTQANLETSETSHGHHEKALVVLQELEKTWRGTFEQALASVVSEGLSAVFEDEIELIFISDIKREVASLDIKLKTNGLVTSLMGAKGGSVINVLSVLLRILLTISSQPPMRRLLVLDEPFTHVSAEYRSALCSLLDQMAERLDIQFILTSHEPELADAADVAYQILKDGRGTAVKLKSPEEERQ